MNDEDEIAIAVLVGMKRCIATPVFDCGSLYTVPKNLLSPGPGSNGADGNRNRLSASIGISKSRPLRKKTVSKVKVARCKDAKRISKQTQGGLLNSPISVTSTHHHQLEIRKTSSSLLPNVIPNQPFSQVNHLFLPQFASNDEANALNVFVGNLLQEQQQKLMALSKQFSPQDMAVALLITEIERMKSQISAQQAQSRNFLVSIPNLVSNLQGYTFCPAKIEEIDKCWITSALIASWALRTCPNIAS
jgi:hypothetical protein